MFDIFKRRRALSATTDENAPTRPRHLTDRVFVNGKPFVYSGDTNDVGTRRLPFPTWRVHFPGGHVETVAALKLAGHDVVEPPEFNPADVQRLPRNYK